MNRRRRGLAAARSAMVIVLAATSAACGVVPFLPAPPPLSDVEPGAPPPVGDNPRIEAVKVADDGLTVSLVFTGGPPFDPMDSCSAAYVGWAALDAADPDLLHALVVDVTPRPLIPDDRGCDAVGDERVVQVAMAEPFTGGRVVDDTALGNGTTWLLRPPVDLAVVPPVPALWTLAHEESLPESPGGRWSRTYTAPDVDANAPEAPGRLIVIQGFDQPAGVSGGSEVRDVVVHGAPAVLSRAPETGELVLVWQLEGDGMAVIANEADFSVAELIRFAEGIRLP